MSAMTDMDGLLRRLVYDDNMQQVTIKAWRDRMPPDGFTAMVSVDHVRTIESYAYIDDSLDIKLQTSSFNFVDVGNARSELLSIVRLVEAAAKATTDKLEIL